MALETIKLLVVEDNEADFRLVSEYLKEPSQVSFEITHCKSLCETLKVIEKNRFAAALLDLGLPDSRGLSIISNISRADPEIAILVLTGLDDEKSIAEALRRRAQDYLVKGRFQSELLARSIRYAIERKHAEQEIQKARDELEIRVKQRTAELAETVSSLRHEIEQRERAEKALQESEEKYKSLVEVSPEAICVAVDGEIAFANAAALKFLGASDANGLVGRSMWDFIHPDSIELVKNDIKRLLEKKTEVPPREVKLICLDGSIAQVEASATTIVHQDKLGVLAIFHDITERKRAEAHRSITNALLELFVQKTSRKEYLDSVVETIRSFCGCRCVGIRLANDEGYIPYESSVGFSKKFLSLENMLSVRKDMCLCIRAIKQMPESQDIPLATPKGSFHSNNTFEFLNTLNEKEKSRYRGTCMKHGFASLAVVPIRYRQEVIGAVHLADKAPDKAPLETVEFLEDMAALIGEAVHRFNVEESLRSIKRRLLEAQRLAHLGNWDWDIIRNKLWWSDEVYRIFGVKPQQFDATYEAFLSYIHPDDRKFVEESVNKAICEGKAYSIDHRVIMPNGSERIVHEQAEVTYDANQKPVKMIGTVQDVTEQKKAEEKIRRKQKQLRSLTAQLNLTEERERHRIAQDLHDSIGQILSFSGRELKTLQKSLPGKIAESLKEITNQLDIAVEQARTLSFDLSPSSLYDLGFEVAVEDLVDRMSRERKIRCCFENCQLPKPMTNDVKVLLYRSVRELLINAAKHANAGFIKVSLLRLDSDIHIKVEDDGRGFDVSVLDGDSKKAKGFGIFSIRERLDHIGGRCEIESAKDKGTRVTLVAPLQIETEQD